VVLDNPPLRNPVMMQREMGLIARLAFMQVANVITRSSGRVVFWVSGGVR